MLDLLRLSYQNAMHSGKPPVQQERLLKFRLSQRAQAGEKHCDDLRSHRLDLGYGATQRLQWSSFLVLTYFLLRDYNILPQKDLHSSLWVGSLVQDVQDLWFRIFGLVWECSTIRGPNIGPPVVGLLLQGHPQTGPSICRDRHMHRACLP